MHIRESDRFAKHILRGEAYFGPVLAALQGPPERHGFFLPTARLICETFEGPIRVLEVGSWAGASSISWVNAFTSIGRAVTIDCVDQWVPYFDLSRETDAHYRQMNEAAASEDIYALFLHNLSAEKISDQVDILRGPSKLVLAGLKAKAYHLIYIDGSHLYPDVLADIRQAKRLIRNRGIICGDDLEVQAHEVPAKELAQAVKTRLDYTSVASGSRFFHPGVTAAVAEELGVVSAWEGYWATCWERRKAKEIVLDLSELKLPVHIQRAVDARPLLRLIEEEEKFRIWMVGEKHVAVASHIDLTQVYDTVSLEIDLPPAIYIADSLDDLRRKLAAGQDANVQPRAGKPDEDSPVLIRTAGEFNLVSFNGQVIGIHLSSGPVDVREGVPSILERLGPDNVLVGANEASVLCGIALLNKIKNLDEGQNKNAGRVASRIAALEAALRKNLQQSEARQAESAELLDLRFGKLNGSVEQLDARQAGNTDMLGSRIVALEAALRRDLQQSEARQAESAELLDLRFGKLNGSVEQLDARQAGNTDMLGSRIVALEVALRKDLQQSEARQAESAELLGSRITEAVGTANKSVEQLEARQKGTADMLGSRIAEIDEALRKELEQSRARQAETAELLGSRITDAVGTVSKSVEQLEARQKGNADILGSRIAEIDEVLRKELEQSRARQAETAELLGSRITEAVGTVSKSVEQLDARQKGNADILGSRIAEIEETLRKDLEQSEARLADNANLLGSRITEVVRLLNKSVEQLETSQAGTADKLGARIGATDAALKMSLRQSEARQTESVEFLRQHVAESTRILTNLTQSFVGKLILPTDKNRK